MRTKIILLAGVAALSLTACGKSNGKEGSPKVVAATSSQSPFDAKFKLSGGSQLDIDAWLEKAGYDGPKPYASASFDNKLGATIVNDIKFDDGEGTIITISKAELFGVDEAAIDRIENGERSDDSPFETIFKKVRLYDIAMKVDESALELADDESRPETVSMDIGGLELDTLKFRQGGVDDDADGGVQFAQFMNAIDLAGIYMKDYELNVGGAEIGKFDLSAPDFRLVGFGGGKLNAIIANDFEYTFKQSREAIEAAMADAGPQMGALLDGPLGNIFGVNGQRVKAKSMSWKNIDASGFVQYGLKGETPPTDATDVLSLGSGEISDFEQYIGEKRLMSAKTSTFKADEFTWLIPNKITSDVKQAQYDLTAYLNDNDEQLLGIMNKYGLNDVKGDGDFAWTWDDKAGTANVNYNANTDKLADFSMSFNAGNLVFEEMAQGLNTAGPAALAGLGNFQGFNFKITDKNLLNMVYDIAAIQMGGGTGDDIRTSAPAMLRLSSGQFQAFNPLIKDYVDAIANFLSEGGTLEISANPEQAVPFAQFAIVGQTAPQSLPNLLNLKMEQSN